MRKLIAIVLFALSIPLLCGAEESVGRLTAREGVKLDGIAMPTAGIPSWPLHEGSVIETGAYPAFVMLGGDRIEVAAHSTAIVESGSSASPVLRFVDQTGADSPVVMAAAAPAQVRTSTTSAPPPVSQLVEISIVDDDGKGDLGDPPAGGPPCSDFPPILVNMGLVRCTP